jgi:hypothetical protein
MKTLSKEAAELLLNISNNEELQAFAKELYPELGKKQLPESWEELQEIEGYYLDSDSNVKDANTGCSTHKRNKNVFATQEQAEAAIAMAQLSQLMEVYNDEWEADWSNYNQLKYCIGFTRENLEIDNWIDYRQFLAFKDQETAELFLENFRELIEQAKPLL